jgi:hypothetical protein
MPLSGNGQLISKGLSGILNSPKKNEQKKKTLLLRYLRSSCFCLFFGRNLRHQKDISKLTDLYTELTVKNLEAS